MDNEGLRLGLFLGGVIMAAVPVSLGVACGIFLFKQYKKERLEGAGAPEQKGARGGSVSAR